MKYCYYPGCTLKNKAKNFDLYAREICKKFDIEIEEIDTWQCCGGLYTNDNDIARKLASVRNLYYAKQKDLPLLTLCASCHNVVKRVNYDMKNNPDVFNAVNNYLEENSSTYNGETKVVHFIEMLKNDIGFDKIKNNVVNPLNKKVACYYGCQLLRPSKIMNFDNPENPHIMQNLIEALNGVSVKFDFQNECCGSYDSLVNKDNVQKLVSKICNNAIENGAEIIVTVCPLCLYNLKKYSPIPVLYLTQVMAECLGLEISEK
ncbi:MAG: CoB--CoM heterodisulfide reductase iron-sulfur subunit B family protein [Clostridia bacterium]|nr:CoB--CoM heterodisulfide reductase iron-sulfur subunit B family protein [Clostridia bacterium]